MEDGSDDEDVDGVPLDDVKGPGVPDPVTLAMRHPVIPGGLLEPEQRQQVTLSLGIKPQKVLKRNNVKKAFVVKAKRKF